MEQTAPPMPAGVHPGPLLKVKQEPPDWTQSMNNYGGNGISPCLGGMPPMPHIKQEPGTCSMSQGPMFSMPSGQPGDQMGTLSHPPQVPPPPPSPGSSSSTQSKRGRKRKAKEEPGENEGAASEVKVKQEKITDSMPVKKKRDRFNGMTEEEVLKRTLPDLLVPNLDIIIIGINPGLTAAYVGHHYAGPGNHFWKCLYLSGLIPEPMNAYDDSKLANYGIGFTNIVERTSRGSADLTRKEIKEGGEILLDKIKKYRPKIAVFNGKGIYEVFCGHKNFYIGKQPEPFPGTDCAVFVMPSSSARCSQLPRAVDKVPFYLALKRLRDHARGHIPNLDDSEVTFPDLELKVEPRKERLERLEAEGKLNPDIKNKRKKRKKDGEDFTPMPPFGPGMGPFMPGAFNGGQGGPVVVKPEPGLGMGCYGPPPPLGHPMAHPSMGSLFSAPPTLVKQEDLSDLASHGITPSSLMSLTSSANGLVPSSYPSYVNGSMPPNGFSMADFSGAGAGSSMGFPPPAHMHHPHMPPPGMSMNGSSPPNAGFHHSPGVSGSASSTSTSSSSSYPSQPNALSPCQSSPHQAVMSQNHSPNFPGGSPTNYWSQQQQSQQQQQQQQQQAYNMGGSPPPYNQSSNGSYTGPGPSN